MRAGQRAPGGGVAGAARAARSPASPPSSASAARANGPSGAAARRSPSAATVAARASAMRGAMLGHPRLQRGEPGLVPGPLLGEQFVARAHRRFVAGGVGGMIGAEREHEPVEEAAAARGGVGEQPVHRRRQPEHRQPFRQRIGRGRRAVDADLAALGRGRRGAGADVDVAEPRRHREAARRRRGAPFRRASRRAGRGPGESSDTASSTLVLPAPFSPVRMTKPGPGAMHGVGIGAEIGQAEAGDVHAPPLEQAPPPSQLGVMRLGRRRDERRRAADRADGGGRQPADPAADGPERLEALIALIDGAQGVAARPLLYLGRRRGRAGGCATPWSRRRGAASRSRCWSTASARRRAGGFFQPLVEAQARFCRFVPRWGRRYLLRNHQKLALADGSKAIIGGFNISDDYFGTIEAGAWRDLGLQVEGPSVACLVRYFEALFAWAETARRLDPAPAADAVPAAASRDGAAPLAVRRADAAAQPLGALGQERPDAARRGSTSSPPISRRACR